MSDTIRRNVEGAAAADFDLIVVGGGIHGIMVALEATRRRLRPLLIERGDFAGATSHNSLRILHGGLRYLQSVDLRRALESIAERTWWLENFPDLVEPLPCLMPLYDEGLRRPGPMRAALRLNEMLRRMGAGVADQRLGTGQVIEPDTVVQLFPSVDQHRLSGGAVWHDLAAPSTARLFMEALRWACHEGAIALNYVEAIRPLLRDGRLAGVEAEDRVSGARCSFRAPVAVAAVGPWTSGLLGVDLAPARGGLLAWNLLLRRPPPSAMALAVKARGEDAQTYFLVPRGPWLLAGTAYDGASSGSTPSPTALSAFLTGLNEAVPDLDLDQDDIVRVFAGRLDVRKTGASAPSDRPTLIDAGRSGGLPGLFAVTGPKLTTARATAARLLDRAIPKARAPEGLDFRRIRRSFVADGAAIERWVKGERLELLRQIAEEEAVLHLDDLILRRSPLGDRPWDALRIAPQLCRTLGWSSGREREEIGRLRELLAPPSRPAPAWLRPARDG
jgi:glycerol-3-phosphate dehydrogenase